MRAAPMGVAMGKVGWPGSSSIVNKGGGWEAGEDVLRCATATAASHRRVGCWFAPHSRQVPIDHATSLHGTAVVRTRDRFFRCEPATAVFSVYTIPCTM